MFFKNEMRPAMAGAQGQPDTKWSRKSSSIMFSNGAAESADFGAFGDEPERPSAPPKRTGGGKKGGFEFDKKTVIIAAVAAVLVIALVIGLLAALFSGAIDLSGNIKLENNAYLVYQDSQDKYRIVSNGELLEEAFDGEVTLIPADDNSFAYVFHDGEDGLYMYLLEGKKLEAVFDSAVESYVAVAGLEPGIVFTENSSSGGVNYMLYNERYGVDIVAKDTVRPDDFVISDDGQTVVYTQADKDTGDRVPYMFKDAPEQIGKTGIPVAVSYHGDYIYFKNTVKVNDVDTVKLFVRDMKKEETYPVNNSEGFVSVLEMNVKGDEVIFCTGKAPENAGDLIGSIISGIVNGDLAGEVFEVTSYLYRHKASEEKSTMELGPNFVTTSKVDPEIAIYKTFKDKYLQTTSFSTESEQLYTYRLNSKFEKENISKYSGRFSPDGEYLYCINKDNDLIQYNLKDTTKSPKAIYRDVKDFAITEKGNIYLIDDGNYLVFYKISTSKKPRISSEAIGMSYYSGSNKLYFAENEAAVVYVTEEGNSKDAAKFGSTELTALPYFSSQLDGKCYAVVFDETKESYSVYYSSNGNSFKYIKDISDCAAITYGVTIPEALEW